MATFPAITATYGATKNSQPVVRTVQFARRQPRETPLAPRISADEEAAHAAFIEKLGPSALWLKTGS